MSLTSVKLELLGQLRRLAVADPKLLSIGFLQGKVRQLFRAEHLYFDLSINGTVCKIDEDIARELTNMNGQRPECAQRLLRIVVTPREELGMPHTPPVESEDEDYDLSGYNSAAEWDLINSKVIDDVSPSDKSEPVYVAPASPPPASTFHVSSSWASLAMSQSRDEVTDLERSRTAITVDPVQTTMGAPASAVQLPTATAVVGAIAGLSTSAVIAGEPLPLLASCASISAPTAVAVATVTAISVPATTTTPTPPASEPPAWALLTKDQHKKVAGIIGGSTLTEQDDAYSDGWLDRATATATATATSATSSMGTGATKSSRSNTEDADFAFALQLQQEEDVHGDVAAASSRSSGASTDNTASANLQIARAYHNHNHSHNGNLGAFEKADMEFALQLQREMERQAEAEAGAAAGGGGAVCATAGAGGGDWCVQPHQQQAAHSLSRSERKAQKKEIKHAAKVMAKNSKRHNSNSNTPRFASYSTATAAATAATSGGLPGRLENSFVSALWRGEYHGAFVERENQDGTLHLRWLEDGTVTRRFPRYKIAGAGVGAVQSQSAKRWSQSELNSFLNRHSRSYTCEKGGYFA